MTCIDRRFLVVGCQINLFVSLHIEITLTFYGHTVGNNEW